MRFPASTLFKANDGRDVLQIEFPTYQRSFRQIYVNCILWERAIEHLDIPVFVLKIIVRYLLTYSGYFPVLGELAHIWIGLPIAKELSHALRIIIETFNSLECLLMQSYLSLQLPPTLHGVQLGYILPEVNLFVLEYLVGYWLSAGQEPLVFPDHGR